MKNRYMFTLIVSLAMTFVPSVEAKKNTRMNPQVSNLTKLLKPGKMDESTDASHLAKVETRLIAILNVLETSSRKAGPSTKDLLKQAYAMRSDTDKRYAFLASSAIYDAWKEARYLGLFDISGAFNPTIEKGPDSGKEAAFQYIIPIKYVPTFSNSFCNVELKSPSKQRVSDDPSTFSPRMIGYGKMLLSYKKPAQLSLASTNVKYRESDGRIYSFRRSKAEYETRWSELRKADPASAKRRPNITTKIERKSSPSKMSGGKYIQTVIFENHSSFPTEITFKFCFIGKQGENYTSLLRKSMTTKILPGDKYESQESFAAGKSKYRGYAAVVLFGDRIISSAASDSRMNTFTNVSAIDELPGK